MTLRFARRAHVTDDHVAVAQIIAAQLRLGNIDIIRADPVIRTQETNAFVHDFQDAAADFQPLALRFNLADAQD